MTMIIKGMCLFSNLVMEDNSTGNLYNFIDIYIAVQLQFIMTLAGNV